MSLRKSKSLTPEQEKWRKRLSDWKESGESQMVFARRHGLELKHLYNWKSRLGKLGLWPEAPASFIRASVMPEAEVSPLHCLVRLQNGICLELDPGSLASLERLVTTLSRLS